MKKALSLLLCLALLFSLAPVEIHAAEEEPVTLDLAQGSIVISATGYAQDGGAETPYTGDYTIVQTDTTYVDKTIAVTGGEHKITMGSKVEIDVHAISSACAFSIAKGASVELVLTRPVTLKSGSNKAGLAVPSAAMAPAPDRMNRSTSPAARSQLLAGLVLPASAAATIPVAPAKTVRSSSTGRRL